MTNSYLIVAVVLFIALCGGMYQVLRGPTPADRMLAIQLFGTIAVAILVLIGEAMGDAAMADVALVFALLAAVTMVAFVRHSWTTEEIDESRK
jgi:multicomponent Na+:H+ antiporter subunit F